MNGISEKPILDLVDLVATTLKMSIAAIALKKDGIVYVRQNTVSQIIQFDKGASFSGLVFDAQAPVEYPDTQLDPVAKEMAEKRKEFNIRFFYGLPLKNQDGEILGVLALVDTKPRQLTDAERETIKGLVGIAECLLRSFTVGKNLEEALSKARSNEAALMTIFQALPWTVLSKDVRSGNFEFLFWNKEAERMFGAKAEDVIGKTDYDIGTKEEADFFRQKDIETMQSRKVLEIPDEPRTSADGVRSLRSIKIPIYDEKGKPQFLIVICEDITERKKQTALALEAARLKSDFLANMSHEIRTPLNGVIGMVEAMKETTLDKQQRDFLDTLTSCSESLLLMVNDILDITKIEAGRMKLSEHSFAPAEVLKSVGKNFRFKAHQKGLELKVVLDESLPDRLVGDSVRIRQTLMNLVGNSIKFTNTGLVEVKVTWSYPGRLRCTVKDTGIGISPEIQSRLFQTFSQGDASITKEYGGAGLGLSMSKSLVELMGGDIGLISAEGKGSEFWFEVLCPEDRVAKALKEKQSGSSRIKRTGRGSRVLVVEDNVLNRRIVTTILSAEDFQIDYAINGQQACEKYETGTYDIILMDCQMPIMGGYEATERIRAAETLRGTRTPIIAITANAMDGDREKCLAAGMDDYIAKPVRKQHLLQTIYRWLAKKNSDQ